VISNQAMPSRLWLHPIQEVCEELLLFPQLLLPQHIPGMADRFCRRPSVPDSRQTGESIKVVVLVCVMPYSQLPFMMAIPNATTECFFNGLNKGLEYMGALSGIAKSDNMKQ